jgi:hypothetical protein
MSKANPAHPVQPGLSASVCDETLRSFAGYSMKRAFNVVQADLSRALEPFGLRMMTFTALILIVDNPDLSQTALAGALAMERSNLVTIIDELENSGWILRNPAPNDRRSYALHATPAGETGTGTSRARSPATSPPSRRARSRRWTSRATGRAAPWRTVACGCRRASRASTPTTPPWAGPV